MTFVTALVIYYFLYQTFYCGILLLVLTVLNLVLPQGGISAVPVLSLVFMALFLAALYVSGRRAYLAAQAYGERDTSFWDAHLTAGAVIKAELSFLPIIGRFFGGNDE